VAGANTLRGDSAVRLGPFFRVLGGSKLLPARQLRAEGLIIAIPGRKGGKNNYFGPWNRPKIYVAGLRSGESVFRAKSLM